MVDLENLEDSIINIYRKYYLDVYRFLVSFSGNQNDAEDMTQEVFIRVLNNLSNYNYESNLKTWIFSIAKHVAVDNYRKKRFSIAFTDDFLNKIESSNKHPDELIEYYELRRHIYGAISKLKPKYRIVVILRAINELSIKETSQILNCSESKVKVNYHRAIKELSTKLKVYVKEEYGNA